MVTNQASKVMDTNPIFEEWMRFLLLRKTAGSPWVLKTYNEELAPVLCGILS